MSLKYDPLRRYLRRQTAPTVTLTFSEIEMILRGALLPKCAHDPQWWRDEDEIEAPRGHRVAWRDAGYQAALLDRQERVRFVRKS